MLKSAFISVHPWLDLNQRADKGAYLPYPPLDPQHPQHLGKYETKLRSNPQQSRNKPATRGATSEWLILPSMIALLRSLCSLTLKFVFISVHPEIIRTGSAKLKNHFKVSQRTSPSGSIISPKRSGRWKACNDLRPPWCQTIADNSMRLVRASRSTRSQWLGRRQHQLLWRVNHA
jgi:hypothetical protein